LKVPTTCRRSGRCRECVVEITSGAEHLGPCTESERFLREPYRLACQAVVTDPDARVEFAILHRRLRIVVPDKDDATEAELDPMVAVEGGVVHYGDVPIEPRRTRVYGLAVDLGTTTIVFELVDLESGRVVETIAIENPQRFGGS
jgi:uncharacterized 2Fe-2S/4Fe-4S cluster protein (DUF4445 family)